MTQAKIIDLNSVETIISKLEKALLETNPTKYKEKARIISNVQEIYKNLKEEQKDYLFDLVLELTFKLSNSYEFITNNPEMFIKIIEDYKKLKK